MNKLYTAKELADILSVNPQTIYRMANRGLIEDVKIGRLRRFYKPEPQRQNNAK